MCHEVRTTSNERIRRLTKSWVPCGGATIELYIEDISY